MSKKRPTVINYSGRRILLDTIASYWPYSEHPSRGYRQYGIEFITRSGESITPHGNDEISRDKAIRFLDSYFNPDLFTSQKCYVCALRSKTCETDHKCREYTGFTAFKRKEDANVSSEIRGREVTNG